MVIFPQHKSTQVSLLLKKLPQPSGSKRMSAWHLWSVSASLMVPSPPWVALCSHRPGPLRCSQERMGFVTSHLFTRFLPNPLGRSCSSGVLLGTNAVFSVETSWLLLAECSPSLVVPPVCGAFQCSTCPVMCVAQICLGSSLPLQSYKSGRSQGRAQGCDKVGAL